MKTTEAVPRAMERPSASSLRSGFRSSVHGRTIRAVTPDPPDRVLTSGIATSAASATPTTASDSLTPVSTSAPGVPGPLDPDVPPPLPTRPRTIALNSPEASPRPPTPQGQGRRQGIVFNDTFDGPDAASDSPVTPSSPPPNRPPPRQRTYTMEGAGVRQPPVSLAAAVDGRRRIGSFSASRSQPQGGVDSPRAPDPLDAIALSPSGRSSESPHTEQYQAQRAQPTKDRKLTTRRLIKRQSNRPTSPLISPPPSVDSLPLPIATEDANKVLLLMKNLCGRMRGKVEYQLEAGAPWNAGMAYIEEDKGSLMFDSGEDGPFHSCLIADLRGCRVIPVDYPEKGRYNCLEILAGHFTIDMILRPLGPDETDLWLAALLCWQQLRPVSGPIAATNGKPTSPVAPTRPELRRHTSAGSQNVKPTSIIKIGRVMLWDKGLATSPRAIVKRPSTRDLRSPSSSWRRVSCILQDNGELKLLTETDSSILSVIELSQLSRGAIQPLDRTVLNEEFCIAIFPTYTSTSTQLSIFRPVYLALDTRVHFEVWFVLLRAFAVPDLYRLDPSHEDGIVAMTDPELTEFDGVFRVEKSLSLRVTEAKMRLKPPGPFDPPSHKSDNLESLVGNYFAEVILDGEVRARTPIKTHTRNPFWRSDCEFQDLQAASPYLSVVLKRVEGHVDSSTPQGQQLSVPRPGGQTEVMCGSVDIPMDELDRGQDHEQWLQVLDDQQQPIATMFVKVFHEELVVLQQKDYHALSELLHRFPSGLTSQIAEVMPTSLRRLAEIFLNIFQVSGAAADWLMALVEDEIDGIGNQTSIKKYRFSRRLRSSESLESTSDREQIVRDMGRSLAGEANLLFRGNSLLTQALEFHMRRLGKEYLQDVLRDKVAEINELNPDCEIDPSRIRNGDELQQHWDRLIEIATEVWDCIAGSADKLPPELRHILKYIRAVADDRYGDFLRTVSYTSVSGFLFLRFICPAILSPKLFGLIPDFPRPRAQRTLTLVAKTLQAMANMTTFGQKEGWMEPMNKFLGAQRTSMKELIDQVCAIPADRSMNPVPAPYSTPATIMGRLSPMAKEGSLSLPHLIDQSRNYAALVRLWVDANPLADAPPGPRTTPSSPTHAPRRLFPEPETRSDAELRTFSEVCAGLQRRCDASLAHVEALRSSGAPAAAGAAELWGEDEVAYAPTGNPVALRTPGAPEERGRTMEGEKGDARGSRNRGTRGLLSGIIRLGRSDSPDAKGV